MTNNINEQKPAVAGSEKYQAYRNDLCPPDKMIEWFVKYYGEENRAQIEQMFNEVPVVFLPKNVLYQDILMAFKKVYQDMSIIEVRAETNGMLRSLTNLSKGEQSSVDAERFAKYSKVLKELGIEPSKILLKGKETGKIKFAENEEVEKLRNRIKYSVDQADTKRHFILPRDIFILYDTSFFNGNIYMPYGGIELEGTKYNNKYVLKHAENQNKEFTYQARMISYEELNQEDLEFLQNFVEMECDFSELTERELKHVVKGINKLFNKNHTSIQDVLNDKSLQLFLTMRSDIAKNIPQMIALENSNKADLMISKQGESLYERNAYLMNNPYAVAWYSSGLKDVTLPIEPRTTLDFIIHEFNHALSNTKNQHVGFREDEEKSRGFNEIVNEFLSQQIVYANAEEMKRENVKFGINCDYDSGVDFMKEFLDTYEQKLKQCQLGDAPEILKGYIGEANYKTLIDVGKKLEEFNYGKFTVAIQTENGKEILNAKQWFDEFEKDPMILDKTPTSIEGKLKLDKLYNCYKFLNELVAHFKDFEADKIVDIDVHLFDFNSIEKKYEQSKQMEQGLELEKNSN